MNDLIERYIYAVTRRMKKGMREDVSKELRSLIDDMLLERCGDLPPTDKDVRVVLTELGSPRQMREQYEGSEKACLIGQPHYSLYIFVLKIVLIAAGAGLTLALGMEQLFEPQPWIDALTNWASSVWNTLLAAFAFVTVLFAVLHHKGVQLDHEESLDHLPPVPEKKQQIKIVEPVAGIVFSVAALAIFLAVPQVFCVIETEAGVVTPLFDTAAIRGSWYLLALWTGCTVIREVVKLMERRHCPAVAWTTAATNGLSIFLIILWGTRDGLISAAAQERVAAVLTEIDPQDVEVLTRYFGSDAAGFCRGLLWLVLGIIITVILVDTVVTMVKGLKK